MQVTPAARRRFALTAWFFECDAFPTDAAPSVTDAASQSDTLPCAMPNGYGVAEGTPRASQHASARSAAGGAGEEVDDSGERFLHNQCEFLVCEPRAAAG